MDAEVMVPPLPSISATPTMDFYGLNIPPKWVSQETIQCIAREAAGRILVAERKAVRCQQDLAATKEEAVKMLVRMKQMMDSKIAEAEKESLVQSRQIKELEYQLMEAEDIILSLRTELSELLGKFDRRKGGLATSDEHIPKESAPVLEDAYNQKKFSSASPHPEPLKCTDEGTDANARITSGLQHGNNSRLCSAENRASMKNFDVQNPDLASIIMRHKETESCRNGCTQRIRAFENSLLSEHWPNPGGHTHRSSFLKNVCNVANAIEQPSAIPSAMAKQENKMTKSGGLTWPKQMIDVGGRTDARYSDMVFSTSFSRSKKNACQQSKFDNRNLPDQLLVSGPDTTKPFPQTMASVTSNTSRPGENNLREAVEKSDNDDSKHDLQPTYAESGKESPRECEENMVLSCNTKCSAGSTNADEFIQSDILNVSARNSDSECPVKEVNIHGHASGCPPVGSHGSGPGDGASILGSDMDNVKENVKCEDDSEACTLPSTKVIRSGGQGQESVNDMNPIKHDSGVSNGLGANPVEQSITGSELLLQNSDMEETHCKSVATPLRTVNDKFLKYTFHRKRKREVISNKTEEVVVEKKPCSKKRSARRRRILHKLPDFGQVMESSRDSRRLMQVARQLISLSEMRW
ncbi:uncharacterized protein LOC116249889 isoform X1 [Nymphaea colorata]|nr:uncharacterized protein LOC116249889 isoform X1 [Nymphaea colorata]